MKCKFCIQMAEEYEVERIRADDLWEECSQRDLLIKKLQEQLIQTNLDIIRLEKRLEEKDGMDM